MGRQVKLLPPEPLAERHALDGFHCGNAELDDWLRRRARGNQASGASRTYVMCSQDAVLAYYALASGHLHAADATGRFRRNMPEPIPVAILGRLAVDASLHGQGIGRALFRDAALRVMNAAEAIGVRGLIVHAISEEAKAFYVALGLSESPSDPMILMATLGDLRAAL
jgi:GNAT superfamily N-acetyltransferase